jgi:uncharacterized protein (TIGR02687 family)
MEDLTMSNQISSALRRMFERYRIVFWYDDKRELRSDFEALQLEGVEKIELTNNEFRVKYHILREKPHDKFLLYKEGAPPPDLENWLLDVQLAYGRFRTDQVAIWLTELELGLEFADMVQQHAEFFKDRKRRDSFKALLGNEDTVGTMRMKMLSVCTGSEPRIDSILESLCHELASNEDKRFRLIKTCALDDYLWEQMERAYGYSSEQPGILDFVIELFKSCYAMGTGGAVKLNGDALVFLRRWKDSRQYEKAFEILSTRCADILRIEQDLMSRDFREVIELDYFRLIDQKIISDLIGVIHEQTVSTNDVSTWVRQRRQSHWYRDFEHLYEALDYANHFMAVLKETRFEMGNVLDGIKRYTEQWFKLDRFYRKFTYHVQTSGEVSLMTPLTDRMEKLYSNKYLLSVNDRWQSVLDGLNKWDAPISRQKYFFKEWVTPFFKRDTKVCVIISDGLRYDIGEELVSNIRSEDRFEARLVPMLSMLPSYTQLGMAAMLPYKELSLAENETGIVLVDQQSSQGIDNRNKILEQAIPQRTIAKKAEEVMALTKEECRALVRDHDLIYIYHNRIDATGDKRESEEQIFEAVESTLTELINLVKRMTNANVSNLLVTTDHGFIYQHRPLDESDFMGVEVQGDEIYYRNRRFVIGKGLREQPGLKKYMSSDLGLTGDIEVQIPKSINRLRLKGAGSRYVHGGAALQEVIIPVIHINKRRQSDVSAVEVDILRGASSLITSGQLAVSLYQTIPASEKVQPRTLRVGIYTQGGDLISDTHEIIFDLTSDKPREREIPVRLILTRQAEKVNGQEVILRLDEKVQRTAHYKEYRSIRYTMRRSFTSDFDF